jgi:DNA-binding transcriptional MocR family regulator
MSVLLLGHCSNEAPKHCREFYYHEGMENFQMAETILFTRGVPPTEALPTARIGECMQAALASDGGVILQYGNIGGYPALRRMLSEDYNVAENQILIGNGSLHLQDLFAATQIEPGATVLVEQPSYDRAIKTFRRRGAKVIGIDLEHDGVNLAQLEAEVRRKVPAFMYVIPDFQNPAGISASEAKRRALVDLAEDYGFWLIEDVPYRTLRYRGESLPLLRDISPRRVITMSSYSKLISPALRVGYMVGPAELVGKITRLAEDTILAPVLPSQAAVAEFRRRGWLEENVASLKKLYEPRLNAMVGALKRHLPGVSFAEPEGGFFVSVMLPEEANTANLLERAQQVGLVLTDGKTFFADPADGRPVATEGERFVRLPFCAVTPEQIEEGVRRLASLL